MVCFVLTFFIGRNAAMILYDALRADVYQQNFYLTNFLIRYSITAFQTYTFGPHFGKGTKTILEFCICTQLDSIFEPNMFY